MKLFAFIFLVMGLLFAAIGFGWLYVYVASIDTFEFTEELIGPLVFLLFGIVFSSIGGGIFYYRMKQKQKRDLLLRNGRKLRGVISNVYMNESITISNNKIDRHPLIVECVAELSGRKHTFKSHNIWNSTSFETGQEIAVYVDTRDSNNYWVDAGD